LHKFGKFEFKGYFTEVYGYRTKRQSKKKSTKSGLGHIAHKEFRLSTIYKNQHKRIKNKQEKA